MVWELPVKTGTESVKHFVASLDKFKVAQAEKDELLAVVASLKKDIVDKP